MNDAALMEKYGLSSKGLESLFRKLVLAGEIMQAELDRRLLTTHCSHYVDLDVPVEPSAAKCRIQAADAMADIRAGMSDAALMKKYDLSVKGLSSLFRKLIVSGKIEQTELDRRSFVSQQSHFVDLYERPEPAVSRIRVKASELAACIRSGMDDAAIMEKFNLSARGLGSLLRKLAAAGRISRAELDARKRTAASAEPAFLPEADSWGNREDRFSEEEGEFELASPSPRTRLRLMWQDRTRAMLVVAAVAVVCAVAVGGVIQFLPGSQFWLSTRQETTQGTSSREDLQAEAAEVTVILENINRDPYRKAALAGIPGAENLQQCLKSCRRDHATTDDSEQGLLLNCRTECMARHGKAIKAIRKRYYEDDLFE
jgi:uncharacterized protein (DUF433 family)